MERTGNGSLDWDNIVQTGSYTNNTGFGVWMTPTGPMQWRMGSSYNHGTNYTSPLNQWIYFSIVYNGAAVSAYANGGLVNTTAWKTNPNIASVFTIGRRYVYTDAYMGNLDDIRIYNRALTAAEISAIYTATK